MSSYEYILPEQQSDRPIDWKNASFSCSMVWGNDKADRIWGWPNDGGTCPIAVSDPVEQDDGRFVITITLRDPEPVSEAEALAFMTRYDLDDGFNGTICTMLQEARPAVPS